MSFPFYTQPDSMDCGPTCLRMVAKHYGKAYTVQYLREKTQIGKEGVNLLGISEAAESIGFRTIAVKLSPSLLVKEAPLPAILHWNQTHFVVLYKIKKGIFYVADPGAALLQFKLSEFRERWMDPGSGEGVALLLEPSPAFYANETESDPDSEKPEATNLYSGMLSYLTPHKRLVLQLLLGVGVAGILQLFVPFLTQGIVDAGVNGGNLSFIYIILMAQLALFAGRITLEFVRSWILLHLSTRVNLSILTDFLIKLMKLPVAFFDSKKTGDILQRMNDHSRIESFLTGSSLNVLFSLVNLVIFSVVLALFNFTIFTVFALSVIAYALWVLFFLRKRKILDYKRFDIAAREQGNLIQLIQGMQEIKLIGVEKPMRWKWERLQAKLFRLNIRGLALNQWQQAGALFINEGKNIFISFLSAKAVIEGQMTMGTMLAVQYIIGQLNSPIEQMISFAQSWQNARISMDRLNEIHRMKNEESGEQHLLTELPPSFIRQLAGGKRNEADNPLLRLEESQSTAYSAKQTEPDQNTIALKNQSAICLSNVSFTYNGAGNEPVLKNINLLIPQGKTTAIVGVSGSGKTTLLKLLLKFYDPQNGEIRLGDTALSSMSHRYWRSHCGVVMQESYIFSDTIARNIAVGEEKINMDKLRQAATLANIEGFISGLPLGFNTKIGAEGNGLSMGQKQRLLIARAVYRNPSFIFFDEATNSLDANNESIILQNLNQFFRGRTVLVVAHRLSTVKHADQIIVLNKGEITERGTHQELVNLKGDYYQLVKNQLELER